MLPLPGDGSTASAAAGTHATTTSRSSSNHSSSEQTWASLKQQLLRLHGRAARKQLLHVLRAECAAVRAALQQLARQPLDSGAAGQQQPEQQGESVGCWWCRATRQPSAAAKGLALYLQGTLGLLDAWSEAVQACGVVGGGGTSGGSSKKHTQRERGSGCGDGGGNNGGSQKKKKKKAKRAS
jgi:hypothetical protein